MGWFNYYGLAAVAVIMIPNILCAAFDKESFSNVSAGKFLIVTEQVGRYGCMLFAVFNIPYTYCGFWFENALAVYLGVGGALLLFYCIGWFVFWKKRGLARAITLSVLPSALFLFMGIAVCSAPLIVCAVVFGAAHITLSCKNCR